MKVHIFTLSEFDKAEALCQGTFVISVVFNANGSISLITRDPIFDEGLMLQEAAGNIILHRVDFSKNRDPKDLEMEDRSTQLIAHSVVNSSVLIAYKKK